MQMVNIFNELIIPIYFFDIKLEWDLFKYLDENLDKENAILLGWDLKNANYNILIFDLRNALKTNANEEYI
jgi:hypothetical protein